MIGLRALKPLAGIAETDGLAIGALTTLRSLEASAAVKRKASLLVETIHHVATVRVRSMATIGGAIAHADPFLDTPPALIVLDGQIVARSERGQRTIPVDRFFTGYYETVLDPDEIVTQILLPPQPGGSGSAFLEIPAPATQDDLCHQYRSPRESPLPPTAPSHRCA